MASRSPTELDLWNPTELASSSPRRRQGRTLASRARTGSPGLHDEPHLRYRVGSSTYDRRLRRIGRRDLDWDPPVAGRENRLLRVDLRPSPTADGETQTGFGFSDRARPPTELDLDRVAAADAAERATRLLGGGRSRRRMRTHGRPRSVGPPPSSSASWATTLTGDAVLKGRSSMFKPTGWATTVARIRSITLDRRSRPTRLAFTASRGRRRRASPPGAIPLIVDGELQASSLHNAYSGRRAGAASTGIRGHGAGSRAHRPSVGAIALSPSFPAIGAPPTLDRR